MYFNWVFAFFVFMIIVLSVDGKPKKPPDAGNQKKNQKSCIGNATVQEQGTYEGCGCRSEECEWLIQQKACPLACLSKEYDVNKASEEDNVATVYYKLTNPNLKQVDEKEGTITLRFKISALWEDNRINAKLTEPTRRIKLLPEENWEEASIWNPITSMIYDDFKEVKTITKSSELALTDGLEISNNMKLGMNHSFNENNTVVNLTVDAQMTLVCEFELSNYPLDVQTCHFRMYSENVEQILLNPHTNCHSTKSYDDESFSIRVSFVQEFEGNYAKLGFDIELKRQITPFLFKYYVPCIAIVTLSFISFVVPLSAIPGRVALLVTLFLTLTNTLMNYMVSIINIIFLWFSISLIISFTLR